MNKPVCHPAPSVICARVKPLRLRPRVPKVSHSLKEASCVKAVFARTQSIAEAIEVSIGETQASLNAALYSFSSQRLSKALHDAQERGVHVRLLVDRGKYEDNQATRELLLKAPLHFRVARGRDGAGSKMHHKFVLLDDRTVLTGSYNWTFASEEQNYENLLILQDRTLIDQYRQEFDSLWASADEVQGLESTDWIHAPGQEPLLPLQPEQHKPSPQAVEPFVNL